MQRTRKLETLRVYHVISLAAPEQSTFKVHARDIEHAKLKLEALRGALQSGEQLISHEELQAEKRLVREQMTDSLWQQ